MASMLILAASCSRHESIQSLVFPATPIISSVERVALVVDPYVSMRDQPGETGITVAHGRRGEIYDVTGKKIVQRNRENSIWVNLGTGWVLASSVELFSSHEKAKKAAERLK
jgi:hypothetical protein